jgi:hypothetical protein
MRTARTELMLDEYGQQEEATENPKVAAGLFVLTVLGYGYFYLMSTTTSGDDVLECNAIAKFVESSQFFPLSISVPGHPAFFVTQMSEVS